MGIFGQAGMPSAIIRFFPQFKNKDKKHNNLLSFVLLGTFIASSVSLIFTFLLQDSIINLFGEDTSLYLMQKYYWLIYALMPFLAIFNLLCSYSFNFQRTAITSFFRDVFIRFSIMLLLLLLYLNFITFDFFIRGLVFAYWLQALGMLAYLNRLGEFHINFNFSAFSTPKIQEILKYSLVTMLTGSAVYLINSIDKMMVGIFSENQLSDAGIFTVFFYLGVVISVPYKALLASSMSIVSGAFENNELQKVEKLYRRTSLLMMGMGVFLFVAVCVNLDNIVKFIGDEYAKGKMVAIFIGLNALFNIASSINGVIISQSKIYRYDLYLNLGLVVLNIIMNYFLIKYYGLVGAAVATALSGILYNLFKIIVVKQQFNMQPFQQKSLLIVILGLTTFAFNSVLPVFHHWFLDAIIRTTFLATFYGGLLFYFNLVPDLNNFTKEFINRIRQ